MLSGAPGAMQPALGQHVAARKHDVLLHVAIVVLVINL